MPITITQKSPRGRPGLTSQNAELSAQDRAQAERSREMARFAPTRQAGGAATGQPTQTRSQAAQPAQPSLPSGPKSQFFLWLTAEHNAGHAKFRRLRNQAGIVALEITLSMSVARRLSLGSIAGEPFIGIQQRDLDPLSSVEWTAAELRQSRYQALIVLIGKFADNNIRLVLPANPMSVREFIDPADRSIDIRRVTVAAHGRVSRINRNPVANLRLARRALLASSGQQKKTDVPAAVQKRAAVVSRVADKTHSQAGSFWQKLFG